MNRIWRACGLQPHRAETFKLATAPLFIEKVRDSMGLYLNPPDRALVLCVDEKTPVQALGRARPLLPLGPGQAERWFALLTERRIRRGVHPTTKALEAAIYHYLEASNTSPTPFVWTRTADEILAPIARSCMRTAGTGR